MDDQLRLTLAKALKELNTCMDVIDKAMGTLAEGEVLSTTNPTLARLLGELGVHVAEVENMAVVAKDFYDDLKAQKTLESIETGNAVGKSELMAKSSKQVIEARDALRRLEHAVDVLNRKSRSAYSYLDNSRSRLSFIGREVHHGA